MRCNRLLLIFGLACSLAWLAGCQTARPGFAPVVASWTASPQEPAESVVPGTLLQGRTLRQVVHLSLGGPALRVRLTNEHSDAPLQIRAASVGLASRPPLAGSPTPETSSRPQALSFGGRPDVAIPAGKAVLSDPVPLAVSHGSDVAVSLFFAEEIPAPTLHGAAFQTGFVSAPGDFTLESRFAHDSVLPVRVALSAVLVEAGREARTVVALGDSITDGSNSTPDTNRRWPDLLADRLRRVYPEEPVAVVNQGIAGGRVLRDGVSLSTLHRLDRDALKIEGVSHLILMQGINDLGYPQTPADPQAPLVKAEELIAGYRQIVEQAHARGVKVIASTLLPFEGALAGSPMSNYFNLQKEAERQKVNAFIRNGGLFDGVIDFDRALRDPQNPSRLRSDADSGDALHPNDAGMQRMADTVDLLLLMP